MNTVDLNKLDVIPGNVEGAVQEYLFLDEQIKALEAQKKILKGILEDEAKAAANLTFAAGRYIVNLLQYTQNRIDTDKLKHEKPEVYEAFTREVACTRLNIKAGSGL